MTLGGVASRAKYRRLCLHLERGTIEKISRKKRKRHQVITTFDINADTRVLVDTREADGTLCGCCCWLSQLSKDRVMLEPRSNAKNIVCLMFDVWCGVWCVVYLVCGEFGVWSLMFDV